MSGRKKLSLPQILDREIPDLAIPEPIEGSAFRTRAHVECIDADGYDEYLTVGMVYRIDDLAGNGNLYIQNDHGEGENYPSELFKSVEHGPFRKDDDVQIVGIDDIEVAEQPDGYNVPPMDNYHGWKGKVIKADEGYGWVAIKPGLTFKVPNRCLKYLKRNRMLTKNPLKVGDNVKCVKEHKTLTMGSLYTIHHIEGEWIYFREFDGDRFRYNLFMKWDKPSRVQAKAKKYKARMKLADHVRYYLNRRAHPKATLVSIRKQMVEDNVIGDDVSLRDLKVICDQMFSWK